MSGGGGDLERLSRGPESLVEAPEHRALAEAQRAIQAEASTAHPYFWAGFVIAEGAARRD